MADIKRDVIVKNLTKKGFIERDGPDRIFTLYYKGKKTGIRTRISKGSGYKTYGDSLLGQMKKQLKFSSKVDFVDFITCIMAEKEYINYLLKEEHLRP